MTSKENSFKILLYDILEEINLNSNITRDELFNKCVVKKLDVNTHNYNKQMTNLYKYVLSRSNIKTLKAMSKVKKGDNNE